MFCLQKLWMNFRPIDPSWTPIETNYRNFVTSHQPVSGPGRNFTYDSRGNLEQITLESGASNSTQMQASYPSSCAMATRKVCNKPIWVEDARGNRTDYQYHAQSGQVAKVTSPPNIDDVRAQTRYKYAQKYAYYKKNSNTIEAADTPVWMLVEEAYCQTGAASVDGCAKSGDEVVTTYDYGPTDGSVGNNLLLKSKTVTADGKSRTTCYQYDIYGNQIGETAPKAGFSPSTCP